MAIIYGTQGTNRLRGNSQNDTIYGNSQTGFPEYDIGDDIGGGAGNDTIYGGGGNDTIDGGADDDRLYGQTGDDAITGGTGNDYIDGGEQNDTISAGAGNDEIVSYYGDDTIDGGAGTDKLTYSRPANAPAVFLDVTDTAIPAWVGGTSVVDVEQFNLTLGSGADYVNLAHSSFGNDTIRAGGGADIVNAGYGDDTVHGDDGVDTLDGGEGSDTLWGGRQGDTLRGGGGVDILNGEDGIDTLYGDEGDDTMTGGTENDHLYGGEGIDHIHGNDGNDAIYGDNGMDYLYGGANDDRIWGGAEGDWIEGGANNDTLRGEDGDDTLYGERGDDTLRGDTGRDYLDGGLGTDSMFGGANNDTLNATAGGVDTLDGGTQDDLFLLNFVVANGLDAADTVDGGDGYDHLQYERGVGNAVNAPAITFVMTDTTIPTAFVGIGTTVVNVEEFSLHLFGQDDVVTLLGGNDYIHGGGGADTIDAGGGYDEFVFGDPSSNNNITFNLTDTTAVTTFVGNGTTVVNVEKFSVITGGGDDRITLLDGNDVLTSGGGNDGLNAGGGDDRLIGEAGVDTLTGGTGNDIFVFADLTDTGGTLATADLITDFGDVAGNQDLIDLSSIDANFFAAGNQAFFLDNGANGAELGELFRHDVADAAQNGAIVTFLTADTNGDGLADIGIRFDRVVTTLDPGDFLL